MMLSIIFGKSLHNYKAHFLLLLQSFPFNNWTTFLEHFPGMACDISDAEEFGFELAVSERFSIEHSEIVSLGSHYRFCEVHFKRSLTRVCQNGAILRPEKEMDFYRQALGLRDPDHNKTEFNALTQALVGDYPKIQKWISWYFHPARAKCIFPALSRPAVSSICKYTNAQESLCGDFQRTASKNKLSVAEASDRAVRYVQNFEMDYKRAER